MQGGEWSIEVQRSLVKRGLTLPKEPMVESVFLSVALIGAPLIWGLLQDMKDRDYVTYPQGILLWR